MLLALLALALVAVVLAIPLLMRAGERAQRRTARRSSGAARRRAQLEVRDPGRERRAEQRARELLRSCVNEEEWAMYRDLGFIRVHGRRCSGQTPVAGDDPGEPGASSLPGGARPARVTESRERGIERGWGGERPWGGARSRDLDPRRGPEPPYAYLIYPHKPIVAYVTGTRRLLSEYCVEFPDLSGAIAGSRLPDSDDVLAKWMALTGDERRLIRSANMHLPGRQLDPARVRRDLWRLSEWERQRRRSASAPPRFA